ncbi:MAG: hypothetical protein CL693_04425 [Cellvibrionaceae bacterium]|nr:hypothetical protein [Cellvibrionaceae bacterium]|tara:strand:- start:27831 stop:28658 length:828 start_codon:yes stop_codon:yes gene_type:complete
MSIERKEPTLSGGAPSAGDDGLSRGGNDGSNNANTAKKAAASKATAPQRKRPTPVSAMQAKSSPLVPLALILSLTGLGLAGFSYWQLLKAQQQVSSAELRIVSLEQRLTLSDDESSQSVTVLQSNLRSARDELKVAQSEIRKLWDTRNVNKKAIAANKKEVAGVVKSVKAAAKQAVDAQTLAKSQSENLGRLSSDIALQTEQLSMVSDLSDNQQKRLRELIDKANRADSQLTEIRSSLTKRVKTNEEAIAAIDNYRRSVNRDILDIKRQLNPTTP